MCNSHDSGANSRVWSDYETGLAIARLARMFRTLRLMDLAVIGVVTMVASIGIPAWLGVKDTPAVIALTMGLACPAARRMIAWRRGVEPLRFGSEQAPISLVLFAMLPWLVLPSLHHAPWHTIASLGTQHVNLPLVIRWMGVVLTIVGVLRPMFATLRGTGRIRSTAYMETAGLFLATGSGFLGVLALSWLLMRSREVMPALRPMGAPTAA
jgi:hypothetical protein